MRLYYAPDTISVTVAIALEEAGLTYEPVLVDFRKSAQTSADYLEINPKGRVPALETGGAVLTETGALLEFIAAQAPDAGLVPEEAFEAAKMREVMYYLASTAHINHAHRMRGHRWADEESSWADMAAKVPQSMTATAAHIEAECMAGPYVMGDTMTLADAYLFTIACWLPGDKVDMDQFAKLATFVEMMNSRPSVQNLRRSGILTL